MTKQADILGDSRYAPIAEHGFVGLVETMGSDAAIEQAARVSYGEGTRQVSDTRNLIRYLMRNRHTSPFEMGEVKFHMKLPIFVMRQHVRHRTASLNEYSARYSQLSDEHFHPEDGRVQAQSQLNRQGSEGVLSPKVKARWAKKCARNRRAAQKTYQEALDAGVPRELARINLPLSVYTEIYWKIDLNNFMKYLSLRLHPHAQQEIREYAACMYHMAAPRFPLTFEAFKDYMLQSEHLSRMEVELLRDILYGVEEPPRPVDEDIMREEYGMSKREWREFREKWLVQIPAKPDTPGMANLRAAAESYKKAIADGTLTVEH